MKAIINGRVVTVTGSIYENGTILYDNGRIIAVGENIDVPADAEIIDATNCYVTPGLIDCHTHLCTFQGRSTLPDVKDGNEYSSPITPQVRALDAIYPDDVAVEITRKAGFTTVYTGPGSANLICGTGCSMKLRGHTAEEMVIPGSEMMKFAFGENPKRFYGLNSKMPVTRMGSAALTRETLYKAKHYSDALLAYENGNGEKPKPDFVLDSLVPVIRGQMRCRMHAHRADDILTAVRIAEEFQLDYIIEHATEGYKIADVLKEKNVTCAVGPLLLEPLKLEVWNIRLDTPARYRDAGIKFALIEDTSYNTQWLPTHVGIMMREGLDEQTAFKAVTITAAEIMKLDHRIGSIEPGKDADFAIFDGHPFCNMTKCLTTIIDGTEYHNR